MNTMDENLNEKPPPALYIITTMLVLMIAATAIVFWPRSVDKTTPEISNAFEYNSYEYHSNHPGVAHSALPKPEQDRCRTNEIVYLLAQMQRDQKVLNSQVQSFNSNGGLTDE